MRSWRNRRLQPKTDFVRVAPVRRAFLKGSSGSTATQTVFKPATSPLGGERAYRARLWKDRCPRRSRRSIASARYDAPPGAVFRYPERSNPALLAIGFAGLGAAARLSPPFYSACASSVRVQSGTGILTPGWQMGSSILTP